MAKISAQREEQIQRRFCSCHSGCPLSGWLSAPYFMGHFTESMQLISKWVLCAPGICFHCVAGACNPAPTQNQERFLHNLKSVQQRTYSMHMAGAYLWLKPWQNIFWLWQCDRPQLLNKHQALEIKLHWWQGLNYPLSYLFFFPMHLNVYKNPDKCTMLEFADNVCLKYLNYQLHRVGFPL